MHEITGNLFEPKTYTLKDGYPALFVPDAICITTNGFVKANGQCVMGRGCAKTAAEMFPSLQSRLGSYLNQYGNRVFDMGSIVGDHSHLVAFPVKPRNGVANNLISNVVAHMRHRFQPGDKIPGWACLADPEIIWRSCNQLTELADKRGWKKVVLPRPGCGAGEQKWEDIRSILMNTIDDRFYVITFPRR